MNLTSKDAVMGTAVAGAFLGVVVYTQYKYNKLEAKYLEMQEEMRSIAKYVRLLESKVALEFRAMGRQVGNFNEQPQVGQQDTNQPPEDSNKDEPTEVHQEHPPPVQHSPAQHPHQEHQTQQHHPHHSHQHTVQTQHPAHQHTHQHPHHSHHHVHQQQQEPEDDPEEEDEQEEQSPPKQNRNVRPNEPVQIPHKQNSNRRPISARSAAMNARAVKISSGRRSNVATAQNTPPVRSDNNKETKMAPQPDDDFPTRSAKTTSQQVQTPRSAQQTPPAQQQADPSPSKRRFKPQNQDDAEDVKVNSRKSAKGNISGIGGQAKEPEVETGRNNVETGRNNVEKGKQELDDDLLGDIEAVAVTSKRRIEVRDEGSGMQQHKARMARTKQIAAMMQKKREAQAEALKPK